MRKLMAFVQKGIIATRLGNGELGELEALGTHIPYIPHSGPMEFSNHIIYGYGSIPTVLIPFLGE